MLQSKPEPIVHLGLRMLQDFAISPDSPIRSICPMAISIPTDLLCCGIEGARFRICFAWGCGFMISALDNQLALSTKVSGSLAEKKKAAGFAVI